MWNIVFPSVIKYSYIYIFNIFKTTRNKHLLIKSEETGEDEVLKCLRGFYLVIINVTSKYSI